MEEEEEEEERGAGLQPSTPVGGAPFFFEVSFPLIALRLIKPKRLKVASINGKKATGKVICKLNVKCNFHQDETFYSSTFSILIENRFV